MTDRPLPWRSTLALVLAAFAGWGVLQLAHVYPARTEAWFAQTVFPAVRRPLTALVRLAPVSVAELLLGALAIVVVVRAARALFAWRAGQGRLRDFAVRGLLVGFRAAAVLYVSFLVLWGFDYAREPFAIPAGLDPAPATPDELASVAQRLTDRANELREKVVEDESGVMSVPGGREEVLERAPLALARLAEQFPVLHGPDPVLRVPILSPLLTAFGITGIYSPFTAEVHVNGGIPEVSLPFTACHEIAHARGFARKTKRTTSRTAPVAARATRPFATRERSSRPI